MRTSRVTRVGAAFGLAVLVLAGCSSGGSDKSDTTTTKAGAVTTTTAAKGTVTTTTASKTTTTAGKSTTTKPKGTTTTDPSVDPVSGLKPGDPCSIEEGVPDCIDPDGDGEGTFLIAGNDCMASAPDVALCEDLDGDGYAGYPDSQ